MPAAGLDWAWGQPSEESLHAAGAVFAARYLSRVDASKRITAPESARHLAAGRAIVLVYEDDAKAMLRGRLGGITDATAADSQARAAGLGGAPVYFAADWDSAPADQPAINAYLDGAATVIGHDRVGCYGGYWVLSRVRAAAKARYLWGTAAWSGGNWKTCGWQPHIMQGAQTTVGGVSCDWDFAYADDYGQYKPATPAPVPGPNWTETLVNTLPTLAQGATGEDVRTLQGCLTARHCNLAVDGAFGPATAATLRTFQQAHGLAADGVAGPATWPKLLGR